MSTSRTLIFLGTGTSVGVPMIGCHCHVCESPHPHNHRTRSSILFQFPAGNLLIDTSPELRLQLIREKIDLCHAVLYTHYHADHLFGLDDVRVFPRKLGGSLPIFCAEDVEEVIRKAFSYAFHPGSEDLPAGVVPKLNFHRVDKEPIEILGETIIPIPLIHGRYDVLGFRVGDVAYCTDVSEIPESSYALLQGLDVFVIDALWLRGPHPSHFNLEQALAAIERVKPKRAYLTHMSHEMDAEKLHEILPTHVQAAYDGLRFTF